MASENKITPQNTWGLPLIEHLEDLIKEGDGPAASTNFQRASVTLDPVLERLGHLVERLGDEVEVEVLDVDLQRERISLEWDLGIAEAEG